MTYRLLCFESTVLVEWEELEVQDPLKALEIASARCPALTVELWSDGKKVAIFKPVGTRHRS